MSCGADNALLEEVGSARGLVVSSMDDDRLQPHELACTQGGEQRPASQDGTCGMVQSEGVMRRGDFSPKKCVEICVEHFVEPSAFYMHRNSHIQCGSDQPEMTPRIT